jgi:hypothetical protein
MYEAILFHTDYFDDAFRVRILAAFNRSRERCSTPG